MPEAMEEQHAQLDVGRYLDLVRRRHLQFLIPLLIGWAVVWAASWILPVRYKSTTLILVQQPTVPTNYVVPNVSDNLQNRLDSITQQILSRTRLLLVIDRLHLYSSPGVHLTQDEEVAKMRKDISIDLVRSDQGGTITSFRISYSAPTPHVAQEVTRELTDLFISENQQTLQQESESTTAFIQSQLGDARTRLADQEAKVKQFEAAHQGELPTQQASNLQILAGLQSQLQNEQDSLNTAQQQRVYLQSLIEQYRDLPAPSQAAGTAPGPLATIDTQIAKLKAQLADLSTRYTDRYPEIQSLKAQIATTEKTRSQLMARQGHGAAAGTSGNAQELARNSPLLQLRSQLQANQVEITDRQHDITTLKDRIADYQERLNAEPASQAQLADLTRGYEQSQANYNDLLKKENDSAMATSMERMQEGERFSLLDPPSLPLKPDFPDRLKFCAAGLGFGLLMGALVAGGLEFVDDRLHRDKQIEDILPVPIISEIPEAVSPQDERRRRRRMILGWAVAALVFVVILAGSAFSVLHA